MLDETFIFKLPNEILETVFSHLDTNCKYDIRRTCKKFYYMKIFKKEVQLGECLHEIKINVHRLNSKYYGHMNLHFRNYDVGVKMDEHVYIPNTPSYCRLHSLKLETEWEEISYSVTSSFFPEIDEGVHLKYVLPNHMYINEIVIEYDEDCEKNFDISYDICGAFVQKDLSYTNMYKKSLLQSVTPMIPIMCNSQNITLYHKNLNRTDRKAFPKKITVKGNTFVQKYSNISHICQLIFQSSFFEINVKKDSFSRQEKIDLPYIIFAVCIFSDVESLMNIKNFSLYFDDDAVMNIENPSRLMTNKFQKFVKKSMGKKCFDFVKTFDCEKCLFMPFLSELEFHPNASRADKIKYGITTKNTCHKDTNYKIEFINLNMIRHHCQMAGTIYKRKN